MIIYGEGYGGKQQGMSATYGKQLKFVAFDVKIENDWLSVISAEQICKSLNIEFVHYDLVNTDIDMLDALAKAPSVQAKRNGILESKIREGIVLRPLIELRKNNGERIIAKHKNDLFKERKNEPKLNQKDLEIYTEAQKIADEFCTEMRLSHILGNMQNYSIENTGEIVKAMITDIIEEANSEIVDSKEARRLIGKQTVLMFKNRLQKELHEAN